MALLCMWLQNGSQILNQGYDTKFKHVCRLIRVYSTKFTNENNFQFSIFLYLLHVVASQAPSLPSQPASLATA